MLRRARVLRYIPTRPKVPEGAEEQKDAKNYVDRTEKVHHVAREEEIEFEYPGGWLLKATDPTLSKSGFTLREYMMRPVDTKLQNTKINVHLQMSHMSILCHQVPESTINEMARIPPMNILGNFIQDIQPTIEGQGFTDMKLYAGPPCTPLEELPHGVYATTTMVYHGLKDDLAVTYWRLFQSECRDRFYIVSFMGTEKVFKDHLAQRWFGLYFLNSVKSL
eukprot:TRINITY_DN3300_c0_g1_i1.p1 TRINITY_DN3300_c0_g1~~TRINITY_DN3300_c0_g1_i1.p1  ORF type:complete len:221 (+),score=58.46 TRINITY_DN3300_c0_g1_i1:125-787(+)